MLMFDVDFGESFGASDAFGEFDDIFVVGGGDVFVVLFVMDVFVIFNVIDFDDVLFIMVLMLES